MYSSKYFAYIIRSKSQRHVCRVFLCEVAARHIADAIRNICQSLASSNRKKAANLSQSSTVSSVPSSGTNTERNGSSESVFKPSGVLDCIYCGIFQRNLFFTRIKLNPTIFRRCIAYSGYPINTLFYDNLNYKCAQKCMKVLSDASYFCMEMWDKC